MEKINPEDHKINALKNDLEKLSESFKLLYDATDQVSKEAAATADYLKEKLNNTETHYCQILNSINDLIITKDDKGRWTSANRFAQELYGLSPEDFLGKTDLEIAAAFPQHSAGLKYCTLTDEIAWRNKNPYREIENFEMADRNFYFDIIKTPVFKDGGQRHEIIIVGRDVTKTKDNESRLNACFGALNAASDNIAITDNHSNILFCNDKFLKTFKFDKHSDVEGRQMSILNSKKMGTDYWSKMWKAIRKNKPWHDIVINKDQENNLVECMISILPIMNGSPEPHYYICTLKTKNFCMERHTCTKKGIGMCDNNFHGCD